MKKITYSLMTNLSGQTVKLNPNLPFYVLCSNSQNLYTVMAPGAVFVASYRSLKTATNVATKFNRVWSAGNNAK